MFEDFSDQARRTLVLAQERSRLLRHDYIGTEHLLLGLLDEDHTASRALLDVLVRPADVHQRVVEMVGKGRRRRQPRGRIPFSPPAKRSLELAAEAAHSAGDGQVDPEHLLRGMLAQTEGVGVTILEDLGVDLALLRRRLKGSARSED